MKIKLRDFFAAKAMQGFTSNLTVSRGMSKEKVAEIVAKDAYLIADEMLKIRDELIEKNEKDVSLSDVVVDESKVSNIY